MQEAIAENPQESQKRVVLSGVFSTPYLPHFHRGWYLYQKDRSHCDEALIEWEVSEQHGAIRKFKREYGDLEKARGECRGLVLPPAIGAARTQLEEARKRLSQALDKAKTNPELEKSLRTAQDKFEEARGLLDTGSAESRLSSIRQAGNQAGAVVDLLEKMTGQAERQATDQLKTAVEQAENAVEAAENALHLLETRLEDPEVALSNASEILPHQARERLSAARELIKTDLDLLGLADVKRARDQAVALRNELEGARNQLDELPPQAAEALVPELAPEPLPTTSEPPENDPALVQEMRRLSEAAERFLAEIDLESSPSKLLKLQGSRLEELVREAQDQSPKATIKTLANLIKRLSDSLAALRLVAGAQAYFAGNLSQAIDILSASELDQPLAAHGALLRAASHFALFQIGIEDDLTRAREEARKSSQLDSELSPDPLAFSPQFRKFFAETAQY